MTKSVAELLVELKIYDKRITKAISEMFIGYTIGGKTPVGYSSLEDFDTKTKANLQTALDLIQRRNTIKDAIVESNAKTSVMVGGKSMSVAAAIERKTSIQYTKNLIANMTSQFNANKAVVDRKNEEVQMRLDKLIEQSVGKDVKDRQTEIAAISTSFLENTQLALRDPNELGTIIKKMLTEIEDYEGNVDLALSSSNATTFVELS